MERTKFETDINASREKVWEVLWGEHTYPAWTAVFSEGSKAETDWKEGSKVLFLDGKGEGMVSTIAEKREPEFMSFKHLGIVHNGVEDMESDEVKEWAGAKENYTLTSENGKTRLVVDMDLDEKWMPFFQETWPKAMDKLKALCEKK